MALLTIQAATARPNCASVSRSLDCLEYSAADTTVWGRGTHDPAAMPPIGRAGKRPRTEASAGSESFEAINQILRYHVASIVNRDRLRIDSRQCLSKAGDVAGEERRLLRRSVPRQRRIDQAHHLGEIRKLARMVI